MAVAYVLGYMTNLTFFSSRINELGHMLEKAEDLVRQSTVDGAHCHMASVIFARDPDGSVGCLARGTGFSPKELADMARFCRLTVDRNVSEIQTEVVGGDEDNMDIFADEQEDEDEHEDECEDAENGDIMEALLEDQDIINDDADDDADDEELQLQFEEDIDSKITTEAEADPFALVIMGVLEEDDHETGAEGRKPHSILSVSPSDMLCLGFPAMIEALEALTITEANSRPPSVATAPEHNHANTSTPPITTTPEQALVAELPEERLIETKTLIRIRFHFNTRYGLCICKLCQAAVPLSQVANHALSPYRKVKFVTADGKIHQQHIQHGFRLCKIADHPKLCSEIGDEIREIIPGAKIRDVPIWEEDCITKWRNDSVPFPGQVGPILGLKVFKDSWKCTACAANPPYTSPSIQTARLHRNAGSSFNRQSEICQGVPPPGSNVLVLCSAQTFSMDMRLIRYFPVSAVHNSNTEAKKGKQKADHKADFPAIRPSDALRKRLAAVMGEKCGSTGAEEDDRAINAFFRDTGIHNFLHKFPHEYLLQVISTPHLSRIDTDTRLKRLVKIVGTTFLEDCNLVPLADNALRYSIMNCAP